MHNVIPTRSSRTPSRLQTAALLGAAGLLASLVYVQTQKRQVERDHPPQGKFVDVDGVRLHYVEQGEGPALVLLHGNGVFASDFELSGLLEQAARPYRVIAFDRPGFGYSERPDNNHWTPEAQAQLLYKALHQIGVERPILVGHSWGTLVALAMAIEYPKYIRAITLVSGYYYPSARPDVLMATPAVPGLGHLLRNTLAPVLGRLLWGSIIKRMFAPSPVPERFQQMPKWMALRPSQIGASASETGMMIPAAARLSARYAELTMPVAIIAGDADQIVDPDHNARRLHEDIAHSELIVEPGVGHMAHYAAPERIMDAVARLEASLTPGGANLRHQASMHQAPPSLH
ncbi:alpha/beta fold hydrolase [Massilia sp. CF038]|uniref:alpha/beta fold hydrolase n=1 Tax=Massilia sp. CF038 TaxID=1881045 RepID=UPI000917259F|nr:alpha/beta hydrolase [Massilia sp. CF038]SHG65438.1 Pimeloyl-ACP methyl ester carboxylesterase [Massilia sp. CF038]